MNRQIDTVIDRMLAVIPAEETELRAGLERTKYDAGFRPPEMQWVSWERGAEVLFDRFGNGAPTEEWVTRVSDIWLGKAAAE